jgi:hypothetical protein
VQAGRLVVFIGRHPIQAKGVCKPKPNRAY